MFKKFKEKVKKVIFKDGNRNAKILSGRVCENLKKT